MKVKSIWNRLYSIGQDYNMMTSFRTFKFFHSCLNVFGFQGLVCCFNQNVPGTSLNEFNEHHMRCHGYLHIIAHWRLSFLWAPRKSMWRSKLSTESCIFNNTKGEFIKCFEDEQKNQRPAFSRNICFEFFAGQHNFYCAHVWRAPHANWSLDFHRDYIISLFVFTLPCHTHAHDKLVIMHTTTSTHANHPNQVIKTTS